MTEVPRPAIWLTASGYLPFAAATLAIWLLPLEWRDLAHIAALGYGAVILSFLGGILWGLAIAEPSSAAADTGRRRGLWLCISVVPSLIGWVAIIIAGSAGLWLLTLAVAAMPAVDLAARRSQLAPSWYLRLRLPVSVAVTLTLGLAAIGSGLDPSPIPSK